MREFLHSALRSHNGTCLYGTVLSVCYFPCRYVCKGECFESYVEVGEILYYGAGWSHETQNLVTPTVTITGTVVHEWNYNTVRAALRIVPHTGHCCVVWRCLTRSGALISQVAPKLHGECANSELNFQFSARLCDALDKCYNHWHEQYMGKPKPADLWPAWRSVSSQTNIAKKEEIKPEDNNYDGRNYITE